MQNIVHLDYEFRSGVDINDVGSHRASIDPEFEILMAAVSGEGVDDPVFLWVNPKFRTPDMMGQNREAEELLNSADIVFAHNAPNEQANTWGAFAQGKACPFWKEPPLTIWRCTAAMSRKAGLPNALGDVADFLGTPVKKDKRGKDLIKLFTQKNEIKPTKEAKKAGALPVVRFIEPLERQDEFIAFGSYCCDDVRAEKHVHKRLKPFELSGAQLEMFQFDLRMNQRGIPINVDGARRAQRLINRVQSVVIREFRDLTGLNPTQRQKTQEWLFEHGCPMENMQATTVEEAIERMKSRVEDPLAHEDELKRDRMALRVIELYQKVSYSAVAKIQTMLECVCPDGRVRGGHMFYGAGTGRWSGKLLQPQNFKKTPPELKDITDAVYKAICDGWSPEMIDQIYGDPLEMLSICIRHFIFHPQYRMLDGDYNAVEARIICWLAGETEALEEYRLGVDRYQIMATEIYQRSLEYIKSLGKDSTERQVGKQAVLGCFAYETPVLTSRGLKPIGEIDARDWLWDGVDWVRSEGVIYQGCKKTLTLGGVHVTPEHSVLCGSTWSPASVLVQNAALRSLASDNASVSLLSRVLKLENVVGFSSIEPGALAGPGSIVSSSIASIEDCQPGVIVALGSNKIRPVNVTGDTRTLLETTQPENACSIEFRRALADAIARRVRATHITGLGEFRYGDHGVRTEENFSVTSLVCRDTKTPNWNSIVGTLIGGTNPEISASARENRTSTIDGQLLNSSKLSSNSEPVYDVLNAGPRNRFTIWTAEGPLIVHNCGFGLGREEKFVDTVWKQGGVRITPEIGKTAIQAFRRKHKKIVAYWWQLDDLCKKAVKTPGVQFGPFVVKTIAGIPFLLFYLRSGRALAYPRPKIELFPWTPKKRKFNADDDGYDDGFAPETPNVVMRENVVYWGEIKPRVWGWIKLYGGKLSENETQATAADFMGAGAIEAERQGMEPFMLVHDQGLALVTDPERHTVEAFERALGTLPVWAKGMPLKVEAKITSYYRK